MSKHKKLAAALTDSELRALLPSPPPKDTSDVPWNEYMQDESRKEATLRAHRRTFLQAINE